MIYYFCHPFNALMCKTRTAVNNIPVYDITPLFSASQVDKSVHFYYIRKENKLQKGIEMNRILPYFVSQKEQGQTIETFLRNRGYSRHIISCVKRREDGILVNGKRSFTNYRLSPGEQLTVTLSENAASDRVTPVPLPIKIVYEDEDLLIINKPADTPIHPSVNNMDNTLANAVVYHYLEMGEAFVFRCINRLDRDTTGLLIVAKHMLSASVLSRMVTERRIHREYLAIVRGRLPAFGTITAPIARKEGSLLERCVNFEQGEAACTHFQRLLFSGDYSLAQVTLETGRTHQIRVHMGFLGYPLVGDYLYYPDYGRMKRQSLHSHRLSFPHPITGKPMEFEAPLPSDMQWILNEKKESAGQIFF